MDGEWGDAQFVNRQQVKTIADPLLKNVWGL